MSPMLWDTYFIVLFSSPEIFSFVTFTVTILSQDAASENPLIEREKSATFLHRVKRQGLECFMNVHCVAQVMELYDDIEIVCEGMKFHRCNAQSCDSTDYCETVHPDCWYYDKYIVKCSSCPSITHCATTVCSEPSNIKCTKCEDPDLYKLDNENKECAHKCSWDNRWCWPGVCKDDYAYGCTCDQGFSRVFNSSKATCQQHGDAKPERGGSSKCSEQTDFYGNFQVHHVVVKSKFEFKLDIKTTQPGFVESFMFGVTDASMIMVKKDLHDSESVLNEVVLKSDPDSNNPENLLSKDENVASPTVLENGESLCFRFSAKAGGHLVSKNVQTNQTRQVPYDKTTASRDVCYIYDNVKPSHCYEKGSCTQEPLVVSSRLLRDLDLSISYTGWFDPIPVGSTSSHSSSIETYKTTVYETKEQSAELEVGRTPVVNPEPVGSESTSMNITLPETNHPVLYAIVLEVKDTADNVRQSRRFVLYDNSSSIKSREDRPFLVTSASDKTSKKWQTNYGDLCYSWKDRFYNDKYVHSNLLKPIKPDPFGMIQGTYDQITGVLPVSGTTNVQGITTFFYTLLKDTLQIESNKIVPNFTSQSLCLSPVLNDGDTFVLELTSYDIMENTFEDRVKVHIDSSVPEINNIWLIKDEIRRLYVHNSTDLSKMILEFDAFDPHSGIYSVHWGFGTTDGGSDRGHGSVAVSRLPLNESCGTSTDCYCPSVGVCEYFNYKLSLNSLIISNTHIGNHNRQYFFTIRVINNAQLASTEHVDILVDESQPAPGDVLEGPIGGPDIDYTSDDKVIVHWHGFIDHESGIKLYRVGFAMTCLTREEIEKKNYENSDILVMETTETSLVLPIRNNGRHIVTVLAYNNAMEPSVPVCSDGIVYDNTPPLISNVTLTNANIAESVACSNGTAWLINNNVTRTRLEKTERCIHRCNVSNRDDFIMTLPEQMINEENEDMSEVMCSQLESYRHHLIYIPTDTIELKWNITEDLSQIRDVYVGFGSNEDSKDLPDIVGYRRSKHILWFRDRHSSLSSGTEMFAFIKVVNKAGLEHTISYGPVLIDETPPICPTIVSPELNAGEVIIKWNKTTFYDLEQKEEIGSVTFRIGHPHGYVTSFLQWKINVSSKCADMNYECIRYPMKQLQHYDTELGLAFSVELYFYNYAGHYCTVKSQPFTLPSLYPPSHGMVIDVDPGQHNGDGHDTDFILKPDSFCASWGGFSHLQSVDFSIGVGSSKGQDDFLGFVSVASTNSYCFNSSELAPFQKYFTTIIAKSSGGTRSSSSNGFTLINAASVLRSINLFDGSGCSSKSVFAEIHINSTLEEMAGLNFDIQRNLHVGKTYTFKIRPFHPNITLQSDDVLGLETNSRYSAFTFHGIIKRNKARLSLYNTGNKAHIDDVVVYACENDIEYQTSTDSVEMHWSMGKPYEEYISHYRIGVLSECPYNLSENCVISESINAGKSTYGSLKNLNLNSGFYKIFVKPCFDNICLETIESNGFIVENRQPIVGSIKASLSAIQDTCYLFNLVWDAFICHSGIKLTASLFYRWGVFADYSGMGALSTWFEVISSRTDIEKDTKCARVRPYPHSELYVRVEGFCNSGLSSAKSVKVVVEPDPDLFPKLRIYDIDANQTL